MLLQHQEIGITGHQIMGLGCLGERKKVVIFGITANGWWIRGHFNALSNQGEVYDKCSGFRKTEVLSELRTFYYIEKLR